MKLDTETLNVLRATSFDGNRATLPPGLDRPIYAKTNKALEALGGKWDRKAKAHLFPSDAREAVLGIVDAGSVTTDQEMGFFPTPAHLAADMAKWAVRSGDRVLEPSAGNGALVKEIVAAGAGEILAVEIDARRALAIKDWWRDCRTAVCGLEVDQSDFLTIPAHGLFDAVVMNPPFGKKREIDHVLHAAKFLRNGRPLIAVMPAGIEYGEDKKTVAFRKFVADHNGSIAPLPEGTFKDAGTAVRTVLVKMVTK